MKRMTSFCLFISLVVGVFAHAEPVGVSTVVKKAHAASTALAFDKFTEMVGLASEALKVTNEWLKENSASPQGPSVKRIQKGLGYMIEKLTEKEWRVRTTELQAGIMELVRGSDKWQLYYCPMVKAYWTQPVGEEMANAYMGTTMLDCGTAKKWALLPKEIKGWSPPR